MQIRKFVFAHVGMRRTGRKEADRGMAISLAQPVTASRVYP